MTDLTTPYLGLSLRNPLVVSPSPLCQDIGRIRQMEDAGAAAVVLHSLFEEQITIESVLLDRHLSDGADSFAEALSYFPDLHEYNLGPDAYLEHVRKAKAAVEVPIIASLNGISTGGWIRYAQSIEQAGADALELNIYYVATDPARTAAEVEQQYVDLVEDIRMSVRIPLAVKVGHHFTAFANLAHRLKAAGANGLVLFNRFYQPDLDIDELDVVPTLTLSSSYELLLRLTWVAILYGRLDVDFAVTGGVHTAKDVLKSMMAGAKVAMLTSALLKHGIEHLRVVRRDVVEWMEAHEYESIAQMRGSMSQLAVANPGAYERGNYLRVLSSYPLR
ncbi:MAG: dihydroorotate dehydrogenase-like protein [Gemmatimonadota bacterium]